MPPLSPLSSSFARFAVVVYDHQYAAEWRVRARFFLFISSSYARPALPSTMRVVRSLRSRNWTRSVFALACGVNLITRFVFTVSILIIHGRNYCSHRARQNVVIIKRFVSKPSPIIKKTILSSLRFMDIITLLVF